MAALEIRVDDIELTADWIDDNPRTRRALDAVLPVEGDAARWGEELYLTIPVDVPPEHTQIEVPVGALAYWPSGNALCLFWGPTPASSGSAPAAASPVSVVAQVADVDPLHDLDSGGARLTVSPVDGG